jgi:hypothetical protein
MTRTGDTTRCCERHNFVCNAVAASGVRPVLSTGGLYEEVCRCGCRVDRDSGVACRQRDGADGGVGEGWTRQRHVAHLARELRDADRARQAIASQVLDHRLLQERRLHRTGPVLQEAQPWPRELDLDGRDAHDAGQVADHRLVRTCRHASDIVPRHLVRSGWVGASSGGGGSLRG